MSRHFRPWTIDQTQLLPAAVVDYVPADHLAQFVVALAREHLDLSEIVASYKSGLGQANHRGAWTDAEHERLSATCSPGRCRPGQPRTQAEGDFGGRGLLQRGQSVGARDPEDPRLCRYRASQASGRDHAQGRGRDDAENAAEAEARRLSQPVPIAKADRGAGVRADQASTRISTIPAAWP